MQITRRTALTSTGAAVGFAGCIGGGDGPDGPSGANDDGTDPRNDPTVRTADHPDLGEILVGPDGMTLYMFDRDTPGESTSACYDGCAANWPPLVVDGEPVPGEGVSAELTTFDRDDGSSQAAAAGWPLYHFARDEEPGDVEGQGVNDIWWVLSADGTPIGPDGSDGDDGHDGHGGEDSGDHEIDPVDEPSTAVEVAMRSAEGHHFEPHLVWIEPGGTVTWTTESGSHTTTAYHEGNGKPNRIPDGADGWDSGLLVTDESYDRTFDVEGVYDYYCRPHEGVGMVGSVIVGDPDPHGQPGLEPPQSDLPGLARDVLERLNHAANETLGHTHD